MKTIQISGIIVHEDVLTTKFACDYQVCHGGCCYVENGKGIVYEGCEITDAEEILIEENRPLLVEILTQDNREIPKKLTYKKDGVKYIHCDKKGRCCLHLSNGCALRVAQCKGLLDYGNPIACDLYPLVVTKIGRTHLRVGHYYDEFHLCDSAIERGKLEGIYLIDFCKDSLIRQFGESFFNKLKKRADDYNASLEGEKI